jgi:4-amino-4-deoxy-L-arabinose transferase-like glycosyltransferase
MDTSISSKRVYLWLIICAGFVLRLSFLTQITAIETDGIFYATMADQLTRGLFREALGSVFSPMYPFSVAIMHLVVSDVEVAGRLVSLVVGTLLIYLCFLFARKLLKNDTKALWAALIVAFHPLLIRYSGQVLSESLATLLFTLTVFSFYAGWQDGKRILIAASSLCLVLTYLTRPEYIVFYAPFVLILLRKRRIADTAIFLLPFLVFGALYIGYLHTETGLWIISKKATLSPFVGITAFFRNIPLVVYAFVSAISPLFFVFSVLGYKRMEGQYRGLVVLLLSFHILSLSFISHATKRYSVEFAPLLVIFAAEGAFFLNEYVARFVRKRFVPSVMVCIVILVGIWQSYTPPRFDRAMNKRAGLFLLHHDPGSVIACRLATAVFYAQGKPVYLLDEMSGNRSIERFDRIMLEKRVKYLIVDQELMVELPFLRGYAQGMNLLREFDDKKDFVRVFEVRERERG